MIPDKMRVLSRLHHGHHHHHHHHHHEEDRLCKRDIAVGRKAAHWNKKSQRIARKMSRLEEKLRKYNDNRAALVVELDDKDQENESLSSSSINNNDDAPLESRRHGRRHRRRRRHHQRGQNSAASCSDTSDTSDSSSSSSSSSDSDSDDSKSSSRSVSPRQRRIHRHQRHHHLHHRRRQQKQQQQQQQQHRASAKDDGIYGCVYRMLSRSEPSLRDDDDRSRAAAAAAAATGESQSVAAASVEPVVIDLEAHSYCTARDVDDDVNSETGLVVVGSAAVAQAQDCEMLDEEGIDDVEDDILEDSWKKIVLEGLQAEEKAALTSKYSVAKRGHILQGPRLNPELRLLAPARALERDLLLGSQQSQLGSGLKALARGISSLKNDSQLEKNPSVVEALDRLNDASRLLLDAHRDASRTRRSELRADLRHDVRDALDGGDDQAANDGSLFGGDTVESRLKELRCFKKCQRREERREARSEKGQKRKPSAAHGRPAESSKRSGNNNNKRPQLDLAELSIKNS